MRTPGRSTIYGYDPNRVYLLGHSAGAQIISLIALQPAQWVSENDWKAIRGVVGIQGIYDIPGLIKQRPEYIDFIEMAFGPASLESQRMWVQASPQYVQLTPGHRLPPYCIMHCPDDELVDDVQANGMFQHLRTIVAQTEPAITAEQLDWRVTHECALAGKHFEMLENEQFCKKIVEWIAATEGNRKRPPPAPFAKQASEPASVEARSTFTTTSAVSAPAGFPLSISTSIQNVNPAPPSPAISLTSIQSSAVNLEHPPLPRRSTITSTGVQVFMPPTPQATTYVATHSVDTTQPVGVHASPILSPPPMSPVQSQSILQPAPPTQTVQPMIQSTPRSVPMQSREVGIGIGFIPPPKAPAPSIAGHQAVAPSPGAPPVNSVPFPQ